MGTAVHAAFVAATVIIEAVTPVQSVILILIRTRKRSREAVFALTAFRAGLLQTSSPGVKLRQLSWLARSHKSL